MAIRHSRAGQHAKQQATQRNRRIILIVAMFAAYGMIAMGFVAGYMWQRGGPVLAMIAIVVTSALLFLLFRRVEPYLDRMAKERIKYLRGGQGEGLIAWVLEDLEDDWHIFNGIQLQGKGDIDHIVVGPGGLFCIETKSQRGIFSGSWDGLRHNGQPCDFAKQTMRQAMELKDWLKERLGEDPPWVQPVLAVPFGHTDSDTCAGEKVWLVPQDTITDRIAPENAVKKLNQRQIDRIVELLKPFLGTAGAISQTLPANADA